MQCKSFYDYLWSLYDIPEKYLRFFRENRTRFYRYFAQMLNKFLHNNARKW